ncbi:MAG TPA: hypothetical protein VMV10_25860 [Pirellulales bacterium]|nr:hypothetical protein [Pirellulales bacterium]
MRKPVSARTIGVGLIVGHLLLAAVAAIGLHQRAAALGTTQSEMLFVAVLAISISQAGLIGLWAGLAKAPAARRLAAAIGGGVAVYSSLRIAVPIAGGVRTSSTENWIFPAVFVLAPFVAVALFAAAMRRRGFAIERLAPGEDRGERREAQFSLFHLFAITFVAAILFTLVRQLRDKWDGAATAWEFCPIAAFNALIFVLHTQICLWSALGAGRLALRLGALLFSTALAAAVYGLATGGPQNAYLIFLELMTIYSVLVAGTLGVLRRFGYRLLRRTAPANAG